MDTTTCDIGLAFIFVICATVLLWAFREYSKRVKAILQKWAEKNGFQILQCKRKFFVTGPFNWWKTSRNQYIYFLRIRERDGQERSAWTRIGDYTTGILYSEQMEVKWNDHHYHEQRHEPAVEQLSASGSTATKNDKSKEIRPAFAIIPGVISLLVACSCLDGVVIGLKTGKILWSARGISGVAIKAVSPASYWFHVVEYSILTLIFGWIAFWMLRHALRGLRK